MASIPLSGQIRLGRDFNQQFYYGDNNAAQLNMNSEYMRDYSVGARSTGSSAPTSYKHDQIPYTSGAQRSLSMYRGGCGRYPDLGTTSSSTADNNQAYALTGGGGPAGFTNYVKATNPNLIGSGAPDSAGSNLIAQKTSGNTSGANTAANIVADFGYLEPGNYKLSFWGAHYNSGTHYCIIRGYTGEHMTGLSSNYRVISRNCSWSGGWSTNSLGTSGAGFTVNATYPYVIMSLETHVNTNFYLNTIVSRKDTDSSYIASIYNVNPNIWRES